MLDKQDLQAISELISASEQRTDAKLAAMEQRMTAKIKESSEDTMRGAVVLMEQYFDPKFNALAEKIDMIAEKLDSKVDKEDCENGMSVVAAAVRAHSRDIDELKAQ